MGFRSTLISEHTNYGFKFPKWFRDKWGHALHFGESRVMGKSLRLGLPIASKCEFKEYGWGVELFEDLVRVVKSKKYENDSLELIWFHECGGVTKAVINKSGEVDYYEPVEWEKTDGVTHDYCYNCWVPKEHQGDE